MFSTNKEFDVIYVKPDADITDSNTSSGIAVITLKKHTQNVEKMINSLFETYAKLIAADNENIDINSLSNFNQTERDLINGFHQYLTETNNNIYNIFDFIEYSLTHSNIELLVQQLNDAGQVGIIYNFYPEVSNNGN